MMLNPENKKLLTLLGSFPLTSSRTTLGYMTSTLFFPFFVRSLLSDGHPFLLGLVILSLIDDTHANLIECAGGEGGGGF
jgi:hypothetical protein